MHYYSYFDLAEAYDKQSNHYNTLLALQEMISRRENVTAGFNNKAVIFSKLGLQRHAFEYYSKAIYHFEKFVKGYGLLYSEVWKYYNNRAHYYGLLDKKELMYADIKSALSFNTRYGVAFLTKAEFEILNSLEVVDNFEFDSFSPPNHEKAELYNKRGVTYKKVGEKQKALEDFLKSNELQRSKENLYQIGKQYFDLGNFEEALKYFCLSETYKPLRARHEKQEALKIFSDAETQNSCRKAYEATNVQFGIVQLVDSVRSVGFILGSTWFNNFDTIKFEFQDCATIPQKEDRVRFELDYIFHNGKYRPIAKSVEVHNHTNRPKVFEKKIFHCIIHGRPNAFKSFPDFKYILCYYPSKTFLPFAAIEEKFGKIEQCQLQKKGHLFMEVTIEIQESFPKITSCKLTQAQNIYATKKISSRDQRHSTTNEYFDYTWTCNICDGDASTGCQMSDPENCPRGRGI